MSDRSDPEATDFAAQRQAVQGNRDPIETALAAAELLCKVLRPVSGGVIRDQIDKVALQIGEALRERAIENSHRGPGDEHHGAR